MKFIIYLDGNPFVQGYTRFEFKWSQSHGAYLWEGREIDEKEFNSVAKVALTRYASMKWHPMVKIVSGIDEPAATAVLPPSVGREITVDEALDVMERLAPHRLKKKTGPKPELVPA
jgi:hypothetical protein